MKIENKIAIAFGIICTIIIGFCLYLDNKNKGKIIKVLEDDNMKLILDSLKRTPDLSDEIKLQIEKLIDKFTTIDNRVSNELAKALQLLQIGHTEKAIEDLVKIIEHLLTTHYKNNKECKAWMKEQKKKFDLHNLLTFCKTEKKIDDIEYQFFIAIKTIRNKEDHTLDLKLDNYLNASGLITAIGGIFKLATVVYPQLEIE